MTFKAVGRAFALAVTLLSAGAASSNTPTAFGMIGGSFLDFAFEAYPGTAKVGMGAVDMDKLFFFEERTVGTTQSWYIFFDPTCVTSVDALITFSTAITGIDRTTPQLGFSDPTYGIGNPFTDVYATRKHTGLEKRDVAIVSGNQLEIHWKAGDPGDHLRVYTASLVPEPRTYALLLAGLGVVCGMTRGRARAALG